MAGADGKGLLINLGSSNGEVIAPFRAHALQFDIILASFIKSCSRAPRCDGPPDSCTPNHPKPFRESGTSVNPFKVAALYKASTFI